MDDIIKKIAHVLEVILSLIVLVAVVISIVFLYEPFLKFIGNVCEEHAFLEFLGSVLAIAIGLEFFRVLYKPSIDILIEVIIFVMARHMIVHEMSTMDEFISAIGISVLVVVKYYIFDRPKQLDKKEKINKES